MNLLQEAREQAASRQRPRYFSVQVQLLHECNLACAHCYDALHPSLRMPGTVEMLNRIDAIYTFGKRLGVSPDIHLSGGEPTVRKDIVQLVDRIFDRHDGDALLFTNGTRWTPQLARDLRSTGLHWVQISLEGPEPLTDAVRGKGVYGKAIQTLHLLLDLGFRVTVSITLTRDNVTAIPAFVAELDPLGLHFHLREVFALGNGANLIGLSQSQRRTFYDWAVHYAGESSVGVEDPVHCSVDPKFARTQSGCVAGRNHLCIDVDGSVHPCRPLRHAVGHVRDLDRAWHHPDMVQMRDRQYSGDCGRCTLRWHCGGCRVHARDEGDLFGSDPRCFAKDSDVLLPQWAGKMLLGAERLAKRLR